MGKVGRFFGKLWGGVKKIGKKILGFIKPVAKPLLGAVKFGSKILHGVPGVGNVADIVGNVAGMVENGLNNIENGTVKQKLKEVSSDIIDTVKKDPTKAYEVVKDVVDRGKDYAQQQFKAALKPQPQVM